MLQTGSEIRVSTSTLEAKTSLLRRDFEIGLADPVIKAVLDNVRRDDVAKCRFDVMN